MTWWMIAIAVYVAFYVVLVFCLTYSLDSRGQELEDHYDDEKYYR